MKSGSTIPSSVTLRIGRADEILSPGTQERQVLCGKLEELGRACAEAAKARAPVKTGRLRDSISWRVCPEEDGAFSVAVGTDVPYAAAQELGSLGRPGKHYLADGAAEAWR